MEKSVILLLMLALAGVMITVDAACVEREPKEGNSTESTMEKVSKFFEEVGCTLKPYAEVVKNKVSSGYNYLKAKIDDSNSANKTTTANKKGTNTENLNIILMTNNDSNGIKHVDPDQIIFRESDPHVVSHSDTTTNFNTPSHSITNEPTNTPSHPTTSGPTNTPTHPTTNEPTNTPSQSNPVSESNTQSYPTSNHETTVNDHQISNRGTTPYINFDTTQNHHPTWNIDTTSNFDTTSKFGTTIGRATESTLTTNVDLDDRIAITAPDMCPKGQIMVGGKCRKEIKFE